MSSYRCDRCQWATPVEDVAFLRICRKDTPTLHASGTIGYWPMVRQDDWCGQFSPKRSAPWTATTVEPQP